MVLSNRLRSIADAMSLQKMSTAARTECLLLLAVVLVIWPLWQLQGGLLFWYLAFGLTVRAARVGKFQTRYQKKQGNDSPRFITPFAFGFLILGLIVLGLGLQGFPNIDTAVSFLLLLLVSKLLESHSNIIAESLLNQRVPHDIYTIVYLSFFILFLRSVFDQSLFEAITMVTIALFLLGFLWWWHAPGMRWVVTFGALFKSMLVGVPIVVVLFLLFPRLENPLWRTPNLNAPTRAISGVSDEASINDVSPLSLSDEVVMQVQFTEPVPPEQLLYWRGPVLSVIENGVWKTSEIEKSLRAKTWSAQLLGVSENTREKSVGYQVTIDAAKHNWLFPLEPLAVSLKSPNANIDIEYTRDGQVVPSQKRLIRYDANLNVFQSGAQWITPAWRHTSQLNNTEKELYLSLPNSSILKFWLRNQGQLLNTLTANDVLDNTRWADIQASLNKQISQLPLGVNPRTQLLGLWLQQQNLSAIDTVQLALNTLMAHGTFMYTLSPPPLGSQANDDFLFQTRQGFCQHFALSFGLLMRAAGVPTRLVNGYLGGEINTVNNLWMLREKYAHVWAEVWVTQADGTGAWQRIDPTSLLARGSFEVGQQQVSQSVGTGGEGMSLSKLMPKQLLLWTGNAWAAVENQWNQWVLTYDADRQESWLKRLGNQLGLSQLLGGRLEALGYLMAGVLVLVVLVMAVLLYRAGRVVTNPLDRCMTKLEKAYLGYLLHKQPKSLRSKLFRSLQRQSSETYRAWFKRVNAEQKVVADKAVLHLIVQLEHLKYASPKNQKTSIRQWKTQLNDVMNQLQENKAKK